MTAGASPGGGEAHLPGLAQHAQAGQLYRDCPPMQHEEAARQHLEHADIQPLHHPKLDSSMTCTSFVHSSVRRARQGMASRKVWLTVCIQCCWRYQWLCRQIMHSCLAPGRASASILSLRGGWPSALTSRLPVRGACLHGIAEVSASGKTCTAMLATGRTGLWAQKGEGFQPPWSVSVEMEMQAASCISITCCVLPMLYIGYMSSEALLMRSLPEPSAC